MRRRHVVLSALLGLLSAGLLTPPASAAGADTRFEISNHRFGQCLDHDAEGKVYVKDCTQDMENRYQRWRLARQSNGEFTLQGVATGRCAELSGFKPTTSPCDGGKAEQRWRIVSDPKIAPFVLIQGVTSGRCLFQGNRNMMVGAGCSVDDARDRWLVKKQ